MIYIFIYTDSHAKIAFSQIWNNAVNFYIHPDLPANNVSCIALFYGIHQDKDSDVTRGRRWALKLQPPHASEQKWSMTKVGGAWKISGGKREKFVLGPLRRRSVTNWGEGDEWGHSRGLMKEFLLGPEWGWAHLHHIGVHKPVTSKITQEALWDSHPSNRLGCA